MQRISLLRYAAVVQMYFDALGIVPTLADIKQFDKDSEAKELVVGREFLKLVEESEDCE